MIGQLKLRPYQKAAVGAVVSRFQTQHVPSMLLHLPTGAGKTVIAAEIIRVMSKLDGFGRVLFVARRAEILDQTAATMRRHLPSLTVEIEQGSRTLIRSEATGGQRNLSKLLHEWPRACPPKW
jgi:superfamily II DNA or RNA helicase